ncbi:hypothetical protein D3C73_1518880 [compost metagenome]
MVASGGAEAAVLLASVFAALLVALLFPHADANRVNVSSRANRSPYLRVAVLVLP